jgi:bifunctional DNA-binding transcriptional regulator/antitoxin component of YhaV-PrlF toxin-antitoxin module
MSAIDQNKINGIVPVEMDPITGEFYITFPNELIQKLSWKEGDTMEWIDNFDGSFTLKKV